MTALQRRVMLFLQDYMAASGGIAPSYVEIMEGCVINSRSSVHRVLNALHTDAYIRVLPYRARAIEVLRPVEPIYAVFKFDDETKALRRM